MLAEILREAWNALRRSPLRSFLTMLGIVWGIVAVTLLIAYGSSFRAVLVRGFEDFGKSVVVCMPGQTSEQAGGERAGKRVRLEKEDLELIRHNLSLVKRSSLETVRYPSVTYGIRGASAAVRGVYPEYGHMRSEVPSVGRWISPEDLRDRRRVAFLGKRVREQLFSGRPAVGETIYISGARFVVIGVMDSKIQLSSYFMPDERSVFIPYTAAAELWDARYANALVFEPVQPQFEAAARAQVLATVAERQRFSPTDERALRMWGGQEIRPIIDGISVGLQVLLTFIGALTLGIGGVGVMNIMLVSVDERTREIGLRRALGARRRHIMTQVLAETLTLTLIGGLFGIALSYLLSLAVGTLPLLGPIYEDTSGRGDIRLQISVATLLLSTCILVSVGLLSGVIPAVRASRLDPAEALRYE